MGLRQKVFTEKKKREWKIPFIDLFEIKLKKSVLLYDMFKFSKQSFYLVNNYLYCKDFIKERLFSDKFRRSWQITSKSFLLLKQNC